MPWAAYASMTQRDADAIAVYLKTLPPVNHKIPGPFMANEKPTTLRWRMVPPETSAASAPKRLP
jgi:hypothetical protein